MPTAASITVKKADGTTDIVWSLLTGSGGDKAPFVVRSTTASGTSGQQPFFQMSSRWNGDNTARRFDVLASFPGVFTDSNTGQTEVRAKAVFNISVVIPQNMSATDIGELAAQVPNLFASALVKSALVAGYAPA